MAAPQVIPAQAGIQRSCNDLERLDSRFHGNDGQELTRLHGCGQTHGEAGRTEKHRTRLTSEAYALEYRYD